MEDPDVTAAYEEPEIGKLLKPDDKKALQNFIQYLKTRRKKQQAEEEKRTEQQQLISEKGMMFVGQKIYDLH